MSHPVGAMQGRLSRPFEGRFQAFPALDWREEFARARLAGLSSIEWIYEVLHEETNPVGSEAGVIEMRNLMAEHGIKVRSICADYYMQSRLVIDGAIQQMGRDHLRWLIGRAATLDMEYIVLPFVDASSLRSLDDREALGLLLEETLPLAAGAGIELHLETDLCPADFRALIDAVNHPSLKANHDIGNSAALGFDPEEEFDLLAAHLGSVHVKDRLLHGGTVPLGTGNADLPTSLRLIKAAGYSRPLVLQAARGATGDEVRWMTHNREFVDRLWESLP